MKTVNEVSKLAGVSIRTLQYYDKIGLLKPAKYTEAGYRLYDDAALERLQQILLFRELEFSLKEIKEILDSPDFDRQKALEQQISMLELKKEHLEDLIAFACEIQKGGTEIMDFSAFDTSKLDEYAKEARASWGSTREFREFEEKKRAWPAGKEQETAQSMMILFREFGQLRGQDPASQAVQVQVEKLKDYITEHFYTCTSEILGSLGKIYLCDSRFKENIDGAGGPGTAEFAAEAIRIYCEG